MSGEVIQLVAISIDGRPVKRYRGRNAEFVRVLDALLCKTDEMDQGEVILRFNKAGVSATVSQFFGVGVLTRNAGGGLNLEQEHAA